MSMHWRIFRGFTEIRTEDGDEVRIEWKIGGAAYGSAGAFNSAYKQAKRNGGHVDREAPDVAQWGMHLAYSGGASGQPVPVELVTTDGTWKGSQPIAAYRGAAWHPYTPRAVPGVRVERPQEMSEPPATVHTRDTEESIQASPPRRPAAQPAPAPAPVEPRKIELTIRLEPESVERLVGAFEKMAKARAGAIADEMRAVVPELLVLIGEGAFGGRPVAPPPDGKQPPIDEA